MAALDGGGTQGYNGLLVNTNYRLANGLNVNGNYTWSHCIGLVSTTEGALSSGGNYVTQGYGQNVYPVNRNDSVGNCPEDRRQIVNITLVYRTPKFSTRLARTVLSGWTLGSVFQARSGQPILLGTSNSTDPATGFGSINISTQKPVQLLPDGYEPATSSCSATQAFCVRYLNPAAFAVPAVGVAGNVGSYALHGIGYWQWDQEITRSFRIREGQQLEARFEAFNVTNSFRPGSPNVNVGSPTFGEITTDATPASGITAPARVWQFALKYAF
jgi:hypothetical protein